MDFVIAIPSYNRLKQIQNLLLYLDDNNIIHNNIYIFIDPRNYWDYKKELEDKNYNLIIGKKGLIQQRQFIKEYFELNQKILYLDDDFKNFKYSDDYEFNFINEINLMFEKMVQNNCFLGSVNPTNNLFFCSNKHKYGLFLCVGCCYLEINLKDREFYNLIVDEKEDYTRTLINYNYSGKVYRNDFICVNHKYNGSKGGMNENDNRNLINDLRINILKNIYPDLISIFKKKNKNEIRFKPYKFKKVVCKVKNKNVVLGEYINNIDNFKVYGNENIKLFNDKGELLGVLIKNIIKLKDYDFLNKYIGKNTSNQRGALAGKISYDKLPNYMKKHTNENLDNLELSNDKCRCAVKGSKFNIGNSITSINYGYNFNKGKIIMKERMKKYSDYLENYLGFTSRVINNYFIEYGKYKKDNYGIFNTVFNGLTINKEVRSANHRDNNNYGWGAIINNKKGELYLPSYNICVEIGINDLFLFDSKNIIHSTSDNIEGRYSLVFFQNKYIK